MTASENWQITMLKQRGQFVTIAPPAGIAENDVGYGVLLNGAAPPEGRRMSIDDVTRQLVQELEQNEALQPVGDPQPITVAGTQGRSVTLHSISPFPSTNGEPEKERDWLVTIPRPDGSVISWSLWQLKPISSGSSRPMRRCSRACVSKRYVCNPEDVAGVSVFAELL